MRNLLLQLVRLLNEGEKYKAMVIEECIIESIEEAIKEEVFFHTSNERNRQNPSKE